jgi:uncharacterized membrane protein
MKTLHIILTVIFGLSLIVGILPFLSTANTADGGTLGGIFGNLIAYATIPSIIWVARYYVGKKLKE